MCLRKMCLMTRKYCFCLLSSQHSILGICIDKIDTVLTFSLSLFSTDSPCDYMIVACCVEDPAKLRAALGFDDTALGEDSIDIPSTHLIGVSDPLKPNGELVTRLYSDVVVRYMVGGHAIPRTVESDTDLVETLNDSAQKRANIPSMYPPKLMNISDVTSIGVMSPLQVVGVELNNLIPDPTITKVLESKNPARPLFYNAREPDSSVFTTYGEVSNFITGGPGDLRRLGIKVGDVVAYGAPAGGG